MKWLNLLALHIIFLLCLLLKPAEASEPIRIGLTLGLTGKYSEMSDMQMKGFRFWEADVNKRDGISGRKVQVIIHDDKSNSQIAKGLYEQMLLRDKLELLIAPYSSEITEAVLPVTEKYGYPLLAPGASADWLWQKGYRHIFGVYMPASKYAVGFLELLVKRDFKNVSIAYADDSFSKAIAVGTKVWAERFGLNVVLYDEFKKGTKDLSHVAWKTKEAGADALIVCGHLEESIDMRISLRKIGWHPKVYYASVGPAMQAFYERLKEDADGVFSSSQWEPYTRFPNSRKFTDSFLKNYKTMPSYHAAAAYAAGQILESAVKKTGSLDKEKLRDVLSSMDTMTVVGRYGVDKTGLQIKHFNLIIQWQKGKKEIVWPEELRTAKPIFK